MTGDTLPSGWRIASLGELGEVNRGRSRHRPRYAEHLYGGSYPFIQTGDIKSSGGRIARYQQTYSEAGLAQSRLWPVGTMCITIAANIAETGILAFPACFPDSVVGFVADESKCDVQFIEYTFRYLRDRIQHEASGSVQDNINLEVLNRLRFPIPPLPEQRAIAHILGTLDDKIELNRWMNETLQAMARALFKSWFVDFDPVRAKAEGRDPGLPREIADLFPDGFEDSEKGEVPRGWEVRGLDEIARFLNGLALQKYPPRDGRWLPVIKIAQLQAGNTAGADRASADLESEYVVQDGDILFSWSGSLECVLWAGGSGALNQHLFKVTSDDYPRWLCYLGIHQHLDDFRRIAAGKATTMGHIQRHHLSDATLPIPPPKLLKAMDSVIGPIVESTWKREVESRTLATLRDTLLPKLISGEMRLRNAPGYAVTQTAEDHPAIYTIGHSNHPIATFIALLQRHQITAVADVRSVPFSRHSPQFDRAAIASSLKAVGVVYVYLGDELGARPKGAEYCDRAGVNLAKLAESRTFQNGIERLITGAHRYRLAVMCAESEPLDCHRTIVIARRLASQGISIKHILKDGSVEDHEDAERRLVQAPGTTMALFDSALDFRERLDRAYARREREISHRSRSTNGGENGQPAG